MPLKVFKTNQFVNADKKIKCYKNGQWAQANNLYSYKNDVWVPAWNTQPIYYDNGLEPVSWVEGYSLSTGSTEKYSSYLYAKVTGAPSEIVWVTSTLVDLTNINILYVDWDKQKYHASQFSQMYLSGLYVYRYDNASYGAYNARTIIWEDGVGRRTDSLDVSNLTGGYYISVGIRWTGTSDSGVNEDIKIYKIWGE